MQEENQLIVAAEPPITPDPPPPEEHEEGGEQQITQQPQEQQTPQPKQVAPDVEARARDMGWRPQSEWRGAPDAWKPADEFVRRGEEVLPIVRSRAHRAEAEVAALRGQLTERDRDFDARLQQIARMSQVALERQAHQLYQHYDALKYQAVERGDTEGYKNLDQAYRAEAGALQARTAEAYQQPVVAEPQQPKVNPEVDKVVRGWIGQQDWWHRDGEMTQEAVNYHGYLMQSRPWLTVEDNLKAVEQHLEREFPNKFPKRAAPVNGAGQQRQQQHAPAVEGGGRQPAGSGRAKGWNELPPEAKKAGERFMSQELYTNDAKGRAEYAADYWNQE